MIDVARRFQAEGNVAALGKLITQAHGKTKGELLSMLAFELAFQGKSRTTVARLMRMSFAQTVDDIKTLRRRHYQMHLLNRMLDGDEQILSDYAELKSLPGEKSPA